MSETAPLAGTISSSISATSEVADWTREKPERFWDPSRKLLLSIRQYQVWHSKGGLLSRLICKVIAARHNFWSIVTGAEIPINSKLGGGLMIPHPNGIVIHPDAEIGVNCLIFQQVTIGTRGVPGVPKIAARVDIGAGAKILGPVKVGFGARIGANAVILRDVESGAIAVGVHK